MDSELLEITKDSRRNDSSNSGGLSLPKNHLKYGYITKKLISQTRVDDLPKSEQKFDNLRPENGMMYSLNKKGRWNMLNEFRENLSAHNENPEELRISVLEKHLFNPTTLGSDSSEKNIGTVAYHSMKDDDEEDEDGAFDSKFGFPTEGDMSHKYTTSTYAREKTLTEKAKPQKKGKGRRRGVITNDDNDDADVVEQAQPDYHHIRYEIITQSPSVGIYEKAKRLNGRYNDNQCQRLCYNMRTLQRITQASYEDWELDGQVVIDDDYWQDVLREIKHDEVDSTQKDSDCPSSNKPVTDFIVKTDPALKREKRKKRNSNSSTSADELKNTNNKSNRILIYHDSDEVAIADNESDVMQIAPQNIVLPISRPETTLLINFEMKPVTSTCSTVELSPENLKLSYGCTYYECACLPRRFCIDIGGKVKTALHTCHINGSAFNVQAICIFEMIPNGGQYVSTDEVTHLNIWVNGIFASHVESLMLDTFNPCEIQTVNSIIEAAVKMFTMLPHECFELKRADAPVSVNMQYDAPSRLLHDITFRCLQMSEANEIVMEREELAKKLQRQITVARSYDWDSYDCELTCGICCAWLSTASNPGFCMAQCQHWFCKSCWQVYCSDRIRSGLIPVKCPEVECDIIVDYDVLTTMLPLPQCVLFADQYRDRHVVANAHNWMWCPNSKCGRIVFTENINLMDVCSCMCGEIWCAKCNSPVHWPVNCEDAKHYMEKLKREGDLQKVVYGKIRFVQVKKCPHCHLPMERGDGCHFMTCRCGQNFCWDCGKKWGNGEDHNGCRRVLDNFQKIKLVDLNPRGSNQPDFFSDQLYERCTAHRRAVSSSRLWDVKQQLLGCVKNYKNLKSLLEDSKWWKTVNNSHKINTVSADYASISDLANQIDVIDCFVASFFELYYQYHYVLEYTYLWLQSAFYQKKDRTLSKRIYSLTDRLTFMTSRVEDAFSSGDLAKLIDIMPLTKDLLHILVKELIATMKRE